MFGGGFPMGKSFADSVGQSVGDFAQTAEWCGGFQDEVNVRVSADAESFLVGNQTQIVGHFADIVTRKPVPGSESVAQSRFDLAVESGAFMATGFVEQFKMYLRMVKTLVTVAPGKLVTTPKSNSGWGQ